MKKTTRWMAMSFLALFLIGVSSPALFSDQDKDKDKNKDNQEVERIEEDVPGRADLVKVTHIFRVRPGKNATATACSCPGPEGTTYKLERAKWFQPSFNFTTYTLNSKLGSGVATAVIDAFNAWKTADSAAPTPIASQNDTSPGPGIALDSEQTVSWQSLSATYGSNTLAVTVYWYSRAKQGGFSNIIHFDMAFNTDYNWGALGLTESCGTGSGAFDVRDVGTHEAGHVYGMAHDNGCNLTMNPTAGAGETIKSSLAAGDVNGIKAIY